MQPPLTIKFYRQSCHFFYLVACTKAAYNSTTVLSRHYGHDAEHQYEVASCESNAANGVLLRWMQGPRIVFWYFLTSALDSSTVTLQFSVFFCNKNASNCSSDEPRQETFCSLSVTTFCLRVLIFFVGVICWEIGRVSYIRIYLCYFCFRWKTVSLVRVSLQYHVTVSLQQSKITLQNNCINNTSITQPTLFFYFWLKM